MISHPPHPFPARMAPEIAKEAVASVGAEGSIIDPMCGSGTVLRAGVERGLACTGIDLDPLSVLMARVWTTPIEPFRIVHDAREAVRRARDLQEAEVVEPSDPETRRFISFWFAKSQREQLARVATVLRRGHWRTSDALLIAMSRTIITKEMGASLARDTSHSRPHKVAESNDFDVFSEFEAAAQLVAARLSPLEISGVARVELGDARSLNTIADDEFDMAVTSPPYLNAIDYIRGHRMTLVWLGYEIRNLRDTRAANVGSERGGSDSATPFEVDDFILNGAKASFGSRHYRWIQRYAQDMEKVLGELYRVVVPGGRVLVVIGNSFIRGAMIDNAGIVSELGTRLGLRLTERRSREIPARRRYLPPPRGGGNSLDTRMREEVVLSFEVD